MSIKFIKPIKGPSTTWDKKEIKKAIRILGKKKAIKRFTESISEDVKIMINLISKV